MEYYNKSESDEVVKAYVGQLETTNSELQNQVKTLEKDIYVEKNRASSEKGTSIIYRQRPTPKVDKQEELNKRVLKQNGQMLKAITDFNMKRHVQEENEPVMDDIINSFNKEYAKMVGKSSIEILKLVKDEF